MQQEATFDECVSPNSQGDGAFIAYDANSLIKVTPATENQVWSNSVHTK